jgi:phosphohistidine phosphatase SixA
MSPRHDDASPLRAVHLLRHAHAGDAERWDGPDALRPLSRKGRRQAERLGAFLAAAGVQPDRIITSPKARAAETAAIVGGALGLEPVEDARLADGCGLADLDALVHASGAREPMVVGHDPDLSALLSVLIGARGQVMRKGALATIEVLRPLRPGEGVLRWLLPPELLVERDPDA